VVSAQFKLTRESQDMRFRASDAHSRRYQKYSQAAAPFQSNYNISLYIITYFKGKINKKGESFTLGSKLSQTERIEGKR
jgi:hypothetical protein